MLNDLIKGLCARLSLPLPAPDDLGAYLLAFADGYAVRIRGTRDHLDLSGEICALPDDTQTRDALCKELLALSLGRATRECKTSLPRLTIEGNKLTLQQRQHALPSQDAFESAVEQFLNLIEKWSTLAQKEQRQRMFRSGGATTGFIIP